MLAGQQKTVLVVDDDLAVRRLLVEALTGEAYTVLDTGSGRDALRLAATQQPDLVVLDPGLPGTSTFDVLPRLKHARPTHEIPVLVVTGYMFAGDSIREADGSVPKPFDLNDLLGLVGRLASIRSF